MKCEALIREQYGSRDQCMRESTTMIDGHRFCTQHAKRAMRRRLVYLVGGGFLKVAKS